MEALSTSLTENPKTSPGLKEILKMLKNTILFMYFVRDKNQKYDSFVQLRFQGLTLSDHPDTRPETWDKDDYILSCNSVPSC